MSNTFMTAITDASSQVTDTMWSVGSAFVPVVVAGIVIAVAIAIAKRVGKKG